MLHTCTKYSFDFHCLAANIHCTVYLSIFLSFYLSLSLSLSLYLSIYLSIYEILNINTAKAARKHDIPYPTFVLYANRVHNLLGPSAINGLFGTGSNFHETRTIPR